MTIEGGTAIVLAYVLVSMGVIIAFLLAVLVNRTVHRSAAPARQRTARRRVSYRVACYPALPRRWDPNPRLGPALSAIAIWKWECLAAQIILTWRGQAPSRTCPLRQLQEAHQYFRIYRRSSIPLFQPRKL